MQKRNRIQRAEFVIERFKAYGLNPAPGSRFMRIVALYAKVQGDIMPQHPQYQVVLEADRDTSTMEFVFENCSSFDASSEFIVRLKSTIRDPSLPQGNKDNTFGRDDQFHLYVAAVCDRAGMRPTLEEPDILCFAGPIRYAIAAKRIKGAARLRERVLGAASQIQRAKLPGIIAIDIGTAMNQENVRPNITGSEDEFAENYMRQMTWYADRNQPTFCEWLKGTAVRGIIFHDSYVSDPRLGETSVVRINFGMSTVQHNKRRESEFFTFKRQYDKGARNHWT